MKKTCKIKAQYRKIQTRHAKPECVGNRPPTQQELNTMYGEAYKETKEELKHGGSD